MVPNKGMFTDGEPFNAPEGFYRFAKNMVWDPYARAMKNEEGTYAVPIQIPNDVRLTIPLDSTSFAVISVMNYRTITVGVVNNYEYSEKLSYTEDLIPGNFSGTSFINGNKERIIVFTDEVNKPKFINLDISSLEGTIESKNLFLFADSKIPIIANVEVEDSGGTLSSGSYSFSIAYELEDSSITDFFFISNSVPVTKGNYASDFTQYDGCLSNTLTSKSLKLRIENLDTNYKKFRLAVIKTIEGQTFVENAGTYKIDDDKVFVVYSGKSFGSMLLTDVTVKTAKFDTVKDITYKNKKLFVVGTTREDRYDAQLSTNTITVEWVSDKEVSLNKIKGSYKDGNMVYLSKSFMPNEVYAFFIHWVLNDGTILEGFHIPGREALTFSFSGVNGIKENDRLVDLYEADPVTFQFLENDIKINQNIKWFHTRTNTEQDTHLMRYWENDENYPTDFPGDSLRGKKIRHHKFPSLEELHEYGYPLVGNFEASEYDGNLLLDFLGIPIFTAVVGEDSTLNSEIYTLQIGNLTDRSITLTFYEPLTITYSLNLIITRNGLPGENVLCKLDLLDNVGNFMETLESAVSQNIPSTFSFIGSVDVTDFKKLKLYIELPNGTDLVDVSGNFDLVCVGEVSERKTHPLGIKLSNIEVPEVLKGEVQGFFISYAKREFLNSTALSQSLLIYRQDNNDVFFNFHGPDLFMNGETIAIPTKYFVVEYLVKGNRRFTKLKDVSGNVLEDEDVQTYVPIEDLNKKIRVVKDIVYRPDYSYGEYGNNSEEALTGKFVNPLYINPEYLDPAGGIPLITMMHFNSNVYSPFEHQELVLTGYYHPITYPNLVYETGSIYGGDVVINEYSFFTKPFLLEDLIDHPIKNQLYSCIVCSVNNLGLRYEGLGNLEHYFPKSESVQKLLPYEIIEDVPIPDPNTAKNYLYVNQDYRISNVLNNLIPYRRDLSTINSFPFRIWSSLVTTFESTGLELKRFLPLEYYDMPANTGPITAINAYGDSLMIHTERSLYRTIARTALKTSEVGIVLGSNELFDVDPKELLTKEGGYLGLIDKNAINISRFGYFMVDRNSGQVIQVSESPKEISAIGMRNYFLDFFVSKLTEQLHSITSSNVTLTGFPTVLLVYDQRYERMMLMKKDVVLRNLTLFKGVVSSFTRIDEDTVRTSVVILSNCYYSVEGVLYKYYAQETLKRAAYNPTDFTLSPEILSYGLLNEAWISYHTWEPTYLTSFNGHLCSFKNQNLWKHNVLGIFKIHNTNYTSWIDVILNEFPNVQKKFASVEWKSSSNFDKIALHNSYQCSGELDTDTARLIKGNWVFNKFFDVVDHDVVGPFLDQDYEIVEQVFSETIPWWNRKRFIDRYLLVRMIYNSVNSSNLLLHEVKGNFLASERE